MYRVAIIAGLGALLLMATAAWINLASPSAEQSPQAETPDPTVSVANAAVSPTAPTTAEPTYVGRQVCRECHAENFALHDQHGHAHTFRTASDPEVAEKFLGKTFDAEGYGEYAYHANDAGLFATIPDKFGDQAFALEYALGSGHLGITLLSLVPHPQKGTVAIEHRASWFSDGDRLALTPGQRDGEPQSPVECFGVMHQDRVMRKCVDCHTTTATVVNQRIEGLTANVNCEKCHGPGSEHVRQARNSKTPPSYSVGRADWDTESEIQLCGDCHRLPHTISRKELREYPDPLLRFQPIGMLKSKCFVASSGELKCTTCHNPHTSVQAVPRSEHIQTCIQCHVEDSDSHVACPVSPTSGCVDCHMPKISVAGLGGAFHDHWIRVREDE